MAFHPLLKLHELHDDLCQPFQVGGRKLLLIQHQGRTHLLENRCPHMGAPLTHATLANGLIRCPAHGLEFDLLSGAVQGPLAGQCAPLVSLPLAYAGNTLGVDL